MEQCNNIREDLAAVADYTVNVLPDLHYERTGDNDTMSYAANADALVEALPTRDATVTYTGLASSSLVSPDMDRSSCQYMASDITAPSHSASCLDDLSLHGPSLYPVVRSNFPRTSRRQSRIPSKCHPWFSPLNVTWYLMLG